jgi:hypothetical protein
VALVPEAVVTVMFTAPTAAAGGATAVMVVPLVTVNDVAALLPKSTAVAPVKPLPVIVTVVPPVSEPEAG